MYQRFKRVIIMTLGNIKRKVKNRSQLIIGLLIMVVAVTLAFASIHRVNDRFVGEERTLEGGVESHFLETRYWIINSTLDMEFQPENDENIENGNITVTLLDTNSEKVQNITLNDQLTKTVEIDDDAHMIISNFERSQGNLTYTQTIVFERQPYGLLSVPAFILTIVGLVVTYSGKHQMRVEQKLKEEKKKLMRKKESDETSQEPQFMGVDWGEKQ